ncbi:hypothetical protein [Clostridium tarantellae]|uniref:hypothetical protein n=1 Tax=Clostridium tarantellae TaxID=39493 RepID=UPI00147829A6|nr:hypothetical protein [Clostridium tarantellae]
MNKVIDITNILLFRNACEILTIHDIAYDADVLYLNPKLCKEIITLLRDGIKQPSINS